MATATTASRLHALPGMRHSPSLCSPAPVQANGVGASGRGRGRRLVTRMAPDEEKMTKRSPLDFPIEWERPQPGRRPDIFPQFSPMKTPLPPPPPADPPYEEEDEEEKKEPEPDQEEDPEKQPEEPASG